MKYIPHPTKNYVGKIINGCKIVGIDYEYSNKIYQETKTRIAYYVCVCPYCNENFIVGSNRIKEVQGCKKCVKLSKIYKNKYELCENSYYKIYISDNNYFMIDKDDLNIVKPYMWYSNKLLSSVMAYDYDNKKRLLLHRIITDCKNGYVVDHINGNCLDNRKENLRVVSHKDNMKNRKLNINSSSGTTGVRYNKNKKMWYANIYVDGKSITLGHFKNKDDAIYTRLEAEAFYFKGLSRNQDLFKKYNINIDDYKTEIDIKSNYVHQIAKELQIDRYILNEILDKYQLKLVGQKLEN